MPALSPSHLQSSQKVPKSKIFRVYWGQKDLPEIFTAAGSSRSGYKAVFEDDKKVVTSGLGWRPKHWGVDTGKAAVSGLPHVSVNQRQEGKTTTYSSIRCFFFL